MLVWCSQVHPRYFHHPCLGRRSAYVSSATICTMCRDMMFFEEDDNTIVVFGGSPFVPTFVHPDLRCPKVSWRRSQSPRGGSGWHHATLSFTSQHDSHRPLAVGSPFAARRRSRGPRRRRPTRSLGSRTSGAMCCCAPPITPNTTHSSCLP
jgi:hypothetical protein